MASSTQRDLADLADRGAFSKERRAFGLAERLEFAPVRT